MITPYQKLLIKTSTLSYKHGFNSIHAHPVSQRSNHHSKKQSFTFQSFQSGIGLFSSCFFHFLPPLLHYLNLTSSPFARTLILPSYSLSTPNTTTPAHARMVDIPSNDELKLSQSSISSWQPLC